MEKLELIKMAHVVDQYLAALSGEVTAEDLRKRIVGLHADWQELAYSTTAHLCGVDSAPKGRRKKPRKGQLPLTPRTSSEGEVSSIPRSEDPLGNDESQDRLRDPKEGGGDQGDSDTWSGS